MDFVLFPSGFRCMRDECIDVLLQFLDGGEGSPVQRLSLEDGEPGLDLVWDFFCEAVFYSVASFFFPSSVSLFDLRVQGTSLIAQEGCTTSFTSLKPRVSLAPIARSPLYS